MSGAVSSIATSSHILSRLRAAWLLNQDGLRAIPYIADLKKEATLLYLMPGILISSIFVLINIYLGNIGITDIAALLYTFLISFQRELGFLAIYLGIIFLTMRFLLPGFPKESHASPLMVYQVFAYIFTIRIVYILTLVAELITPYYYLVYLLYIIYFTVEMSFAIRTLVGKRVLTSVVIGFIIFYCTFEIFSFFAVIITYIGV